jgi:sRNA-binding protein
MKKGDLVKALIFNNWVDAIVIEISKKSARVQYLEYSYSVPISNIKSNG